jgi:hypothetical protein
MGGVDSADQKAHNLRIGRLMQPLLERKQLALDRSDVSGEFGQPPTDTLAIHRFEFVPEKARHKANVVSKELVRLLRALNP